MRAIGWLALLAAFAPAARADLIDLSGDSRRSRKAPAFVLRAEGGSEFAPYGRAGACFSYLAENPLGGFEIEVGAGAGFPGVQLGLAVRQLFGDGGDYLAFEIALAGNTVRKLGADVTVGRLGSSNAWSSIGVGFEHRAGFLSISVVGALAFISSFDLVPHGLLHGGVGLAF